MALIDPHLYIYLSRKGFAEPREKSGVNTAVGTLETELIKSWVDKCSKKHDCADVQSSMREEVYAGFYVIDAKRRVLVKPPVDAAYVALSYVWGKRAAETNPQPFGNLDDLPQTVEDALQLTLALGLQYVWTDAQCINQADEEHKQAQIENMDWIYENAFLTIGAATTASAYAGIPGVSKPLLNMQQPLVKVPEGTIRATFYRDPVTGASTWPWRTRGWTFQEEALSQRLLLITDHNYFFRCREDVYTDVTHAAKTHFPDKLRYSDLFSDQSWKFSHYADIVPQYTCRRLSYDQDILNALHGMFTRVSLRTKVEFWSAIPVRNMAFALCWAKVSDEDSLGRLERREGFPSWSWCGWKGQVTYAKTLRDHRIEEWEPELGPEAEVTPFKDKGIREFIAIRSTWTALPTNNCSNDGPGNPKFISFDVNRLENDNIRLVQLVRHALKEKESEAVLLVVGSVEDRWQRIGIAAETFSSWISRCPEPCEIVVE
ncbi:HET-domain-containing protein [Microthyrium microscopicum]|uniref:HET-domain-containing protein n=1 Tax=Microthyrium microscopicum TaxID=703497 RepID=A0A6A6TYC4_9PEZI|nr:HET-domain-containing protein [Microthyrium microscopicum]